VKPVKNRKLKHDTRIKAFMEKPMGFIAIVPRQAQLYMPCPTSNAGQSFGRAARASGGASDIGCVANHGAKLKNAANANSATMICEMHQRTRVRFFI